MGYILTEGGGHLLDEAAGPLLDEAATPAILPVGIWTGSYAIASGFFFPFPAARPVQIPVTNTAGDWLFAVVAWRPSAPGSDVSVCVADDAHNWWEPVGAPSADSPSAGAVRVSVWAAPAARVANSVSGVTNIQVAATGGVLSLCAVIADVSGLEPWWQVAAIGSAQANAATSLPVSAASAGGSLLFCALAHDNSSVTVTGPGGLWGALGSASATNGTDHTADLELSASWLVTSTSGTQTGTASASAATDLAGAIAGVVISAAAPSQPNPAWPVMITEAAIGAGITTPPAELTWTDISSRALSLSIKQGKQYTQGTLSAGQGTIALDNPDGALIPPGSGAFAGIDSGTPLRRRVILPSLASPHYVAFSGFFQRWPWQMDGWLRGVAQCEIADAWAYGAGTLNSMAIEECLLDDPYALWPCTDPSGAPSASNVARGNSLPLVNTLSKYGAAGATADFGQGDGSLTGASSAQVTSSGQSGGGTGLWQQTLTGQSFAQNFYGYALVCADQNYPAISGGVTVDTWFAFTGTWNPVGSISFTVGTSSTTFATSFSIAGGSPIVFSVASGFTFPGGITAGQTYYVLGDGGTSFSISATYNGSAVTATSAGTGYVVVQITWDPVILSARDGQGPVFELDMRNTDGALLLRYRTSASTNTLVAVDTAHDYRSMGLVHVSVAVTQTTYRILVNGGGTLNVSGTMSPGLPASFRELDFGGVMDSTEHGYTLPGEIAFPGVYPGVSPQIRVLSRYWATGPGMVNEAACDRIERILEYALLAGRRWLGQQQIAYEGDLCASGQDIGGQASASSMSNIAQSTLPALLYVAPTGDVFYLAKYYTWNQPVRWTLGTNAAAGEIPYLPDQLASDYDPTRVTSQVQLTQLDDQTVTIPAGIMSATDMGAVTAATSAQYGGQPYQNTGYLDLDYNAPYAGGGSLQDLANWLANVYRKPQNRIQSVTVEAAANSASVAAWEFWAGAAVGDMVTVNVRVPTASTSPLLSLTARITQTDRSSQFSDDGTSAKITCTLDFAPEYNCLVCDDPVRGLLNGSNLLGW